ncbi:MAG: ShlB/FhaC/HecB family hemolysin secretion/activation protein [Gammaproteobacteria bacterium]|nr:ShlB/FhaC/HecB family hemolysin secretion/activation protein [Gammaproteobacteria bacterium]
MSPYRFYCGLGLFCLSASALAAPLPGGVDAGQLQKRFEPQQGPQARPKALVVPNTGGIEAPEGAETMRFNLSEILLDGASVFPQAELQAIYGQHLNTTVSLKQVYQIAADISAHYGNAGYLLSRAFVPPQTIEAGQVKIRVVEGYVDQVLIEGMDDRRPELFQHYIDQITASRPLRAQVLERYLLLANDLPGVNFKSVLEPSKENVGAALLKLTATRKAYTGGFSLDNRGSETSGPWQVLLEGTANDLTRRLDSTTLRFATVPNSPEELRYWQLSHQQVLNAEGLRLELDASKTDSQPGGSVLQQLEVETRSRNLGAALSYPLIRSRDQNLSLSGSLTARLSETLQLGTPTRDDLSILRLGAVYDRADAWAGGGVNLLSATLSQGLSIWGAQVNSRANAKPSFTKLELQARRSQQLAERWSADLRLNGQYTSGSLPSSEEFGLGGERSLRGYEPSEWTGDKALTASLEVRYQVPVQWQGDMQIYGFVDGGKIWRNDPQAGQLASLSADSLGFGARFGLPQDISLNLEAARANDEHADGEKPGWGLYGRLLLQF